MMATTLCYLFHASPIPPPDHPTASLESHPHHLVRRFNIDLNGLANMVIISTAFTIPMAITGFFTNLGFTKPRAEQDKKMGVDKDKIVKDWEQIGLNGKGEVVDVEKVRLGYQKWKQEQDQMNKAKQSLSSGNHTVSVVEESAPLGLKHRKGVLETLKEKWRRKKHKKSSDIDASVKQDDGMDGGDVDTTHKEKQNAKSPSMLASSKAPLSGQAETQTVSTRTALPPPVPTRAK